MLDGPCRIENIPNIKDVNNLVNILGNWVSSLKRNEETMYIDPTNIHSFQASYENGKIITGIILYTRCIASKI